MKRAPLLKSQNLYFKMFLIFFKHHCFSLALSSGGKVFSLRIAIMRHCTCGAVFGAYLVINARHANAPFMSVTPLISANAGLLTKTWKEFLGRSRANSVRVALILVMLMSGLAAVSSAPASNAGTCVDRRDT